MINIEQIQEQLLFYIFILWIILYFIGSRKFPDSQKKYMAIAYQSMILLFVFIAQKIIEYKGWNPDLLWIVAVIAVAILFFSRKRTLPYRNSCVKCGKPIGIRDIFFRDDDLCSNCLKDKHEKSEEE